MLKDNLQYLSIRIENLCNAKHISVRAMLNECGLNKNTIDNIKKGSSPTIEKIAIMAKYFDVSTDYLLGNEQKNKPSSEEESFSQNKKELMALFDTMSDAQQESFLAIARAAAHELSSKDKRK